MIAVTRRHGRLLHATVFALMASSSVATAQYVPSPQPAVRPLDFSPRSTSGVTVRQGSSYRPARTDLGASASPAYIGPAIWSGFYAGLQGAFASATVRAKDPDLGDVDARSWFGGAHIGYLAQSGALVFGIEGDLDLNRSSGSRSFTSGIDATTNRNWTTSARGRLGYAFGNAMLYGTAGVALSDLSLRVASGGLQSSGRTVLPAFVFGGGLDFKVSNNLSLRSEVLHYRFGTRDIDLGGTSVPTKMDETVIRAGITYHFN